MIRYASVSALALSMVACSVTPPSQLSVGDYNSVTPGQVILISDIPYEDSQYHEEIPEVQASTETQTQEVLNPELLYDMGRQAIEGNGVTQSLEVGKYYLELSRDLGNVEAQRVLAVLDLRENPEDQSARDSLDEAAKTSVKAQAHYGIMLSNLAIPHLNNLELGLFYLNKADSAGSHEATFALYQLNKSKNPKQAQKWLVKSATLGNPNAIKYLAHSMAYHQDKEEGLKWILAARKLNDPQATYDYANSLIIGRYQPTLLGYKNGREIEAYYWFQKSAAQGHDKSKIEVNNLKGVLAEMKAASITLEEIERELGL